ncbi:hypothetical protein EDB85DRAFT_1897451 [Lactarius pseudohatsudake]|nr:hypothetical protein EDB85DRAFT_1897451 [Lactarius pseudohatsudake]
MPFRLPVKGGGAAIGATCMVLQRRRSWGMPVTLIGGAFGFSLSESWWELLEGVDLVELCSISGASVEYPVVFGSMPIGYSEDVWWEIVLSSAVDFDPVVVVREIKFDAHHDELHSHRQSTRGIHVESVGRELVLCYDLYWSSAQRALIGKIRRLRDDFEKSLRRVRAEGQTLSRGETRHDESTRRTSGTNLHWRSAGSELAI